MSHVFICTFSKLCAIIISLLKPIFCVESKNICCIIYTSNRISHGKLSNKNCSCKRGLYRITFHTGLILNSLWWKNSWVSSLRSEVILSLQKRVLTAVMYWNIFKTKILSYYTGCSKKSGVLVWNFNFKISITVKLLHYVRLKTYSAFLWWIICKIREDGC